jgi:hypothetical protein
MISSYLRLTSLRIKFLTNINSDKLVCICVRERKEREKENRERREVDKG